MRREGTLRGTSCWAELEHGPVSSPSRRRWSFLGEAAADDDEDSSPPSRESGEGVTVRIAVNPWTGSAVNANVAKVLLERELGYTVELVEIDENTQFPAIATGELDASLEVWPSGHAEDINRYIEGRRGGALRDGGIVNGGELGLIGNIGWWVPTYLIDQQSGTRPLAGSQGQRGHRGRGEFVAGDPTFVSYDDEIIKNLGLDLEVVNSGSERGPDPGDRRCVQGGRRPVLAYFYQPPLGASEVQPH